MVLACAAVPSLAGGAAAQIPDLSGMCGDRPTAIGPSGEPATPPAPGVGGGRAEGPLPAGSRLGRPASDLYCIDLLPTAAAAGARGVVELGRIPSPFGVTVTPAGHHVSELTAWVAGLPDPTDLGPYRAYVAWATPLVLDPIIKLGPVENGRNALGQVSFNKYLVFVSAEASAEVEQRGGPLVLRGRSPSSLMEAHDMLAQAPSAAQGSRPGARAAAGREAAGGPPGVARAPHAGHWDHPPSYPGVPMLPGVMELEPRVAPLLPLGPGERVADLPLVQPGRLVELPHGGTLDLEAGLVRRELGGRSLAMLAFNGQHPGPLIKVAEGSTIFVHFTNRTPWPTSVHWHGVRLDNRFDGVPGVTQEPVAPGESFRYQIFFRDAGIYWYHPHHREDVQQELGLYGNLLVESPSHDYYGPANREEVLLLDDLLLDERGSVPFGDESANFMLMGRFGNVFLVNGEPAYSLEVDRGEVVRFFLTNASNTRTFNVSFVRAEGLADVEAPGPAAGAGETGAPGGAAFPLSRAGVLPPDRELPRLPLKVVGSDVGRFEREQRVESVVLAPAERYVVEVRFDEPGEYALVNHVQGINHRMGLFRAELAALGTIRVSGRAAAPDHRGGFDTLREHAEVVAEIDRYRPLFDAPVDHELVMSLEVTDLPPPIEGSMRYDWVYFNPVEWTGTMPMMNWATTGREVRWILRDPATGRENLEIDWAFRVGDVVKIRIFNDRDAFHAMQHPLHIHGQRFLVLSQNRVANDNLAWKDTVLLPAGSTTDILLELSNPGRWMVHCHIAEHLESGMKLVMEVEP